MPETDDRHPAEIVNELIGNLGTMAISQMLKTVIEKWADDECPPGCEPADKCRLDTYDDHRACVECWLLYMARAAGVALPEGTVRP
jgi:hypothetical protein